jgi:hypothetical protein
VTNYDHLRLQTSVRGAIIGYGILAYAFLVPAPVVAGVAPFQFSARTLLALGVGLQLLVLAGRALARRYETRRGLEEQISPLVVFVLELVADGVTVLLFVLATYGPLVQFAT